MPQKLDELSMARRVASELQPGQVVALGSGLPARVAEVAPPRAPLQLLSDGGALGYCPSTAGLAAVGPSLTGPDGVPVALAEGGSVVGTADWAAMLRGGHVDVAVVQPARVTASGDLIGWTTAATPGLFAPGRTVDLAAGARKVIAMLPHTGSDGSPNVLADSSPVADGRECVEIIVTDIAVVRVEEGGLVLAEVAPGWSYDDVAALTGASLSCADNLKEIAPSLEALNAEPPGKVYTDAPSAIRDIADGATVMIDGFGGPGGMAHYLLVSLRDQGTRGLTHHKQYHRHRSVRELRDPSRKTGHRPFHTGGQWPGGQSDRHLSRFAVNVQSQFLRAGLSPWGGGA